MIAIINHDTPTDIVKSLKNKNIEPLLIPKYSELDEKIAGHPDLQFFIIADHFFCHSNICRNFLKKIEKFKNIIICNNKLGSKYPDDISFNIAHAGKIAFHNTKHTAKEIKQYFDKNNVTLTHVPQGYTKCSTLIVNDENIISADKKICHAAEKNNLNNLCISQGDITLPGYKYGFIGGASGVIDDNVYFTGDVSYHSDGKKIIDFITSQNKNVLYLSKNKPIDIGTIFFIK